MTRSTMRSFPLSRSNPEKGLSLDALLPMYVSVIRRGLMFVKLPYLSKDFL